MKKLRYISVLLLTFVLASCEDTVKVDLDTADPRLVIDAGIEWKKGTTGKEQTVRLTTTTDYYDRELPPVSGAMVSVAAETGEIFDFEEDPGTGIYRCTDFVPVIGTNYTLTVVVEGETYTATEQLVAVPEITAMEYAEDAGFLGDAIEVRGYYQDDPDTENYYLTGFSSHVLPYVEYSVNDDSFTQGNLVYDIFTHEDLDTGSEVTMNLYGISKRFYNYMSLIIQSSEGNPFGVPASSIKGNILNTTNENNYPYGYFRLSETTDRSVTVE
ncbi:DUF4249 family protein [Sinomicrobium soli]|uniref:DUF4249 family protein n=1 Tax=Sinomicrobium sp. N-1-3-6 TaxID=2219864 RepID=UPI000DCC4702|nr:DUF4249 family protein [Sinomicrobium sp. N-1-3-6]RAV28738.1 DUF4249 domain-containing protein [Sinomicrobium sp. N-1-3-6]